jgi:hypothetical protein
MPFHEPWAQYVPDGVPCPTSDDGIRELVALGGLVQASSPLEMTLRMLYCALLDSKYAAVTSAGQNASWLNENCRAIAKRRSDLTEAQLTKILELLGHAAAAMEQRNRFVHDVWGSGVDDSSFLLRSKRGDHALGKKAVSTDDIAATVREITRCAVRITFWSERALPKSSMLEAQLRWEDYLRETDER